MVLVTHRRRTSFQITYIRLIVCDNQGTLELSGISGIDTEIRTQLHRATYGDYQDIIYYAAPKKKEGPKSLDEVDPELLKTFDKLGIP